MKLAYDGFDRAGGAVNGTIDAHDVADATEQLRRRGMYVLRLVPACDLDGSAGAGDGRLTLPRRRRHRRPLELARQVQALVGSGTQLVDALEAVERQAKEPRWKAMVGDLRRRVEEGSTFADALGRHPDVFDPIVRSLVAAGESTGRLGEMLARICELLRKQAKLRGELQSALFYPTLLAIVAIGVSLSMMLLVIPRFDEMFTALKFPVPTSTAIVLELSRFVRGNVLIIVPALAGLAVGATVWFRSASGRAAIDRLVLRLPVMGPLVRRLQATRMARLLGTLLGSHVSLIEALPLVRASFSNRAYVDLMERVEEQVADGEPLLVAFDDPFLVDGAIVEAFRTGEETGDLAGALAGVSEYLDEENDAMVRTTLSMVEPAILVAMGVLVGAMALSMLIPLFDMAGMV